MWRDLIKSLPRVSPRTDVYYLLGPITGPIELSQTFTRSCHVAQSNRITGNFIIHSSSSVVRIHNRDHLESFL